MRRRVASTWAVVACLFGAPAIPAVSLTAPVVIVAVVLAPACAPGVGIAQAQTITIGARNVVSATGDSLTTAFGGTGWWQGGFLTGIQTPYTIPAATSSTTARASSSSAVATSTAPTSISLAPVFLQKGHNSEGVLAGTARITADVCNVNADVVIAEYCLADVLLDQEGAAAYGTRITTYINTVHACRPGIPILWVSCWTYSEYWDGNYEPFDGYIADYNAAGQAACELDAHCVWADIRTGRNAYEIAHNTPSPGVISGVMTSEVPPAPGQHCNMVGATQISTDVMAHVVLTGTP